MRSWLASAPAARSLAWAVFCGNSSTEGAHRGGGAEEFAGPVGGRAGFHKIQGIGAGFIPEILDTNVYDEIIPVSDEDATLFARRLAREEGLLVGISSGRRMLRRIADRARLGQGKVVAAIFCDTGERYLTTDLFQAEGI